nr:hypothetical protein [Tanacetum cinerariifolium]
EGENGCDLPACFTTFSNILFDAEYEFVSIDNQSLHNEDFLEEIFSNPLFEEEINSMMIGHHHFNAEFDIIGSLLDHDSSIIPSSLKIDPLLDEFAGELTLPKSIPPGIDESDYHPENEIRLSQRLLYDNSSPRPPEEFVSENSNADDESFSPSPIMEEIDLTFTPDDPMPPSIEEDDDDSRDILIRKFLVLLVDLSDPRSKSNHEFLGVDSEGRILCCRFTTGRTDGLNPIPNHSISWSLSPSLSLSLSFSPSFSPSSSPLSPSLLFPSLSFTLFPFLYLLLSPSLSLFLLLSLPLSLSVPVGIKSLHEVTDVKVRVTAAKLNLVLLKEFVNEPIVTEPTVKKPLSETSEAKASADKPKVVRKNFGPLLTKDWISDSEDEAESKPKIKKKTVKPSFVKINKAFRVFNNRTRIVKENLHIRFSENTPNIAGSGPNWLFDINALTKSMIYKPVVAGNQSNGNAESKSSQDDRFQPSSDDGKKVDEDPIQESECKDQKKEDNVNITNNVNVVGTNGVNAVGANTNNELSFDLEMPALEDISTFNFLSDHEDDDEEADMNNMDTTIQVSPTPTTRIHKDHLLDQVIGDLHSTTQTRNMSKNLEEHGFVTTIHQRTNHKDLQNYLFGCFLSQEEPKKVIYALKEPSWIEAIQEELLQLKLQEVWTLVDLPYRKELLAHNGSFRTKRMKEMNVKSAFLYRKIEEEVYVCQPLGFEDLDFPDKVYKVEKALYGLHQAPKAWYETLLTYLLDNGFHKGKIDKTLFIRRHKDDILLVQVYVDDIMFGSTKKELCNAFEKMMHEKFQMSSMGELTFFLGLQNESKPMKTQNPLPKDEDGEEVDVHMYRLMIGSLMYLTSLRPDIRFVVCACARYQVNPKATVKAKTVNGEGQLQALVDGKKALITEPTIRRDLQLKDVERVDCLPNAVIFEQLTLIGCQETIEDTVAQTRVLDLETINTTQAMEIESLKRRVKKLERRKRSRTYGLKILYKVGLSARVESSADEGLGEEDASKQGRIADIDANEDITFVSTHDEHMFDVDQDLGGEEVFVSQQDEKVVEKEVDATQIQVTTATTTLIILIDEATLAQALAELMHAKPKRLKELSFTSQKKKEEVLCCKESRIKEEQTTNTSSTKKNNVYLPQEYRRKKLTYLKNKSFDSIQKMFDKSLKRVNTFVNYRTELVKESSKKAEAGVTECSSKRSREELKQENPKKQKIDDGKDTTELKLLVKIISDKEGVAIDAIHLAVKPPSIVD